jgi:hypothetical protein
MSASPNASVDWGGRGISTQGGPVLTFDADLIGHYEDDRMTRADDCLSWEDRSRIELNAYDLTHAVLSRLRVDSSPEAPYIADFVSFELLPAVVNLLRAFLVARRWVEKEPGVRHADVSIDPRCPPSVRLGVAAALEGYAFCTKGSASHWLSLGAVSGPPHWRYRLLRSAGRLEASVSPRSKVRIIAIPGMALRTALSDCDPSALRRAGVGLSSLPLLGEGRAVALAARWRLPLVAAPAAIARSGHGPELSVDWDRFDFDPALDPALERLARPILLSAIEPIRRVLAVLRAWERLPALRAVVLPTTAHGVGRLIVKWANARGVRVAAMQHGIYAFREFDGGDRRADVILTWGPGVADQVREWENSRATTTAVGAPSIKPSARRDQRRRVDRILLCTTNSPIGSALGRFDFQRAFLADVAPGIRQLVRDGVDVRVRIHPAESRAVYLAAISELGINVALPPSGPLADALDWSDLVVSSLSSVAFEAACAGVPVLLWTGRTPIEIRRQHFVPPLSDDLPGMFRDAAEFSSIAAEIGARRDTTHPGACELQRQLARYVVPFERRRFERAITDLAV